MAGYPYTNFINSFTSPYADYSRSGVGYNFSDGFWNIHGYVLNSGGLIHVEPNNSPTTSNPNFTVSGFQ